MNRIKVLQIIAGLGAGGAERLVLDISSRLNPEKFDVQILSILNDLSGVTIFHSADVPIMVIPFKNQSKIKALFQVCKLLNRIKPDIIHAHMFHALIVGLSANFFRRNKARFCFTSHNYQHRLFFRLVAKTTKYFRDADVIFAGNQHPSLNSQKVVVIPNGTICAKNASPREPWSPSGPIKLLSIGRLEVQKNPLGLIHAFSNISNSNVSLDFAGDGSLRAEAESLVIKLGLQDQIRFLGIVSDVRSLLRGANIYVLYSKYEGMPLVLLEAGAEAMPVISTPVGQVPDMVGNNSLGWVAEENIFVETLRSIINSPAEALRRGAEFHAYVYKHLSIDTCRKAHEDLYCELVAQQNNTQPVYNV
jgi:glycosyltransferase involved in cell wall biosynthesis